MNTNQLKKFAKEARIKLITQIGVKLDFVLTQDSAELRGKSNELGQIRSKLSELGREQLIETVAYTWFNRLMALRFMDANGYNTPKVVTPLPGMSNPEILQNALAGNIEEELKLDRQRLNDLIDGRTSISDAQTEAFKLLLVASCNKWHSAMPFMFERISDYTELLLPDDLLSDFSIVSDIRNGMTDEDCQQEELIGWLYQFYISDKKDDVFEGLKKNVKITAQNIPAATQLFTPRWIVRYMVENTLGKLWLTFNPESKLRQHMPYFIETSEGNNSLSLPEGISGIKDITFLDPCQGSGHVLVYAFDLFTKIYEEEGYNSNEIPSLILENNLFGIDIDERAAQLAAFALTMKSRKFYSRFLRNPVRPKVIALENIDEKIIEEAVKLPLAVGGKLVYHYKDLSLYNLTQANNFGSLIQIDPQELIALSLQNGSIWQEQEQKLKEQAEYLSRQYYCVVTNPPYMGAKGMNKDLKSFIDYNYKEGKSDLMTCFMLRCSNLIYPNCSYGMINLPSWLFLSSFEDLRKIILKEQHIDSMLHMGRGIFGIDFGSVAFTISKSVKLRSGNYFRLHQRNFQHILFQHIEKLFLMAKNNYEYKFDFNEYRDDAGTIDIPLISNENGSKLYYKVNQNSFSKIPGSPIGYWLGQAIIDLFENSPTIKSQVEARQGMATGDNEMFIRNWSEVAFNNIGFEITSIDEAFKSGKRFFPYNKGGDYRRWYGNQSYVIKFSQTDYEVLKSMGNHCPSQQFYFQPSVSWARIGSGLTSFRYYPKGFLFDQSGHSIFQNNLDNVKYLMSFLNTTTYEVLTKAINPTLNLEVGNIGALPFPKKIASNSNSIVDTLIEISKSEWDSKELSWNFKQNELIKLKNKNISEAISLYSKYWSAKFKELYDNEVKLNNQFIETYSLQSELSSEVLIKDITILQEETLFIENKILIDPIPVLLQFLSYSIGCFFGRYSIDKTGLILANQGETLQDFLKQIINPSFMPDEDNIIPVLEGEWFNDDIVGRFKVFLKATFGQECFEENLRYIEDTIDKDIRKYFVKDFYNDHIKRYKKRPIYWMFSSPKGHFKALIYMHRYQPDLCSKMLNDYLQPFISKLEAAKQTNTLLALREDVTAREKTNALKEVDRLELMIRDCRDYERTLFTIATQKISMDLDDGVKINYLKFKEVLVPIKGLEKEED
jgi:hypothetical protein